MEINFTSEERIEEPIFSDVRDEQFFVNSDLQLCQKVGQNCYNIIADTNGAPLAIYCDEIETSVPITRILPKVTKINF